MISSPTPIKSYLSEWNKGLSFLFTCEFVIKALSPAPLFFCLASSIFPLYFSEEVRSAGSQQGREVKQKRSEKASL